MAISTEGEVKGSDQCKSKKLYRVPISTEGEVVPGKVEEAIRKSEVGSRH